MPAYKTYGGPCHWDVHVCFYVFLSSRYAKRHIGNYKSRQGRIRVRRETGRLIRRLRDQFDDFFNPDKDNGVWTLYEFPPCCSFHIEAKFLAPPAEWAELSPSQIMDRLPEGCGILVVDRIKMTEHPFAGMGGRRMLLDEESDAHVLAHEVGHILGLPDHYSTPDVPELGIEANGMTKEQEKEHVGHLMGKKDANGERSIHPHELRDIAQLTGMTCDRSECCPETGRTQPKEQRSTESASVGHEPIRSEGLVSFESHSGAVASFDLALESLGKRHFQEFLSVLERADELENGTARKRRTKRKRH